MGLGDLTDESIGLEHGIILLPAHELSAYVFEPVVGQVLQLIDDQLRQSPNLEAIFLVGGFGQSNYLFRRVEEAFAERVGMIGVPPRGELAVVRGAVYFGLNPQVVTERISRRSYGVETRMLFQKDLDPPEFSVIGIDGKNYCRQRFSVYVKKGQSVKIDECVSKVFVVSYPNDTDSDLYAYDGDGPVPRLTTDPAVHKVGRFPIRMPHMEAVKPGDKISLTIRMYFGLTEIKIECTIKDQVFTFTSAFDAADAHTPSITGINQGRVQLGPSFPSIAMMTTPVIQPMPAPGYPVTLPPMNQQQQQSHVYPPSTMAPPIMYSDFTRSYCTQQQEKYHNQQQQDPSQGYREQNVPSTTSQAGGYPPTTQYTSNNYYH
jgi:hypothetical protein